MNAYTSVVTTLDDADRPLAPPGARLGGGDAGSRWELYRLLADPVRPRLLALTSIEELGVGELADLLREGQPKISRHAAALRDAGLMVARKQGTWTLLRLSASAVDDPVVADAVRAGISSCGADGTLVRVNEVVRARDQATREFFARGQRTAPVGPPPELPAYLAAFAPLLPHRHLAVDVGTGDGSLLDVLAPVFEHVVAVDRSEAQLDLAIERVKRLQLNNVTPIHGEIDGAEVRAAVDEASAGHGGADVVFASRVLHHAATPARAIAALASLLRPARGGDRGGALCVLDYEAHDDVSLREQQADLWLGFDPQELEGLCRSAGLKDIHARRLPPAWQGQGPDRHLTWQLLVGFAATGP